MAFLQDNLYVYAGPTAHNFDYSNTLLWSLNDGSIIENGHYLKIIGEGGNQAWTRLEATNRDGSGYGTTIRNLYAYIKTNTTTKTLIKY